MSTRPPDNGEPKNGAEDRSGRQGSSTPKFDLNVFAAEPVPSPEAQAANGNGNGGGNLRATPGSVIVVAMLAALALITVLLIAGSGDGDTVAVPLTLATTTTAAPTTTVATTTTVAVTTTVAPTTTIATTTTTTTSTPIIQPLGSPVEVEELVLGAFAIGDLVLGDPAEVVLGRLASSLGQPDRGEGPSVSAGEFGTCPGDQVTVYFWGPLAIVIRTVSDGNEIFYAYRLDGRNGDPPAPAAAMKTLSGLGLGDTVARTINMYSDVFTVDLINHPIEGPIFRVVEDGVLLWGPITSTQNDGIVEGIFAADPCGGALSG